MNKPLKRDQVKGQWQGYFWFRTPKGSVLEIAFDRDPEGVCKKMLETYNQLTAGTTKERLKNPRRFK